MSNNASRPHPGGGREDCWSEGATETLIEAWGDRYLQLNRGNLRQKDWMEVADAVNARSDGVKPRRTDVQCKNRVDTIKKKYKLEKSKLPAPSSWRFYSRLDHLVGPTAASASAAPSKKKTPNPNPMPPSTITLNLKSRTKPTPNSNPNPNAGHSVVVYSGGSSRLNNSSGSNESEGEGGDRRERRVEEGDLSEEGAYKELARAILRFGEVYERIESAKQEQMMELEKQRMEFTKELEFQRMNMFMEAQLELEKVKRAKNYAPGSGKKL